MTTTIHTINTDTTPKGPFDWTIESHRGMGELRLEFRDGRLFANGCEITRFLSEHQKMNSICGYDLQRELAGRRVLNATVLDYLLQHPELIPKGWKTTVTYFWGTIYRDSGGGSFVRFLYWNGRRWGWNFDWLDFRWGALEPAAELLP